MRLHPSKKDDHGPERGFSVYTRGELKTERHSSPPVHPPPGPTGGRTFPRMGQTLTLTVFAVKNIVLEGENPADWIQEGGVSSGVGGWRLEAGAGFRKSLQRPDRSILTV